MNRITKLLATIVISSFATINVFASESSTPPRQMLWPFDGIFGKFDRRAAQRGFQVYKEVCSACHGLNHLSYRNLEDIGFSKDEVKVIASSVMVKDGPNDEGEIFERPGLPTDHFANPFPNEQSARAANNGALPIDMSLIVKARPDGANYLYSLLTGYAKPPQSYKLTPGLYYNKYFPGHQIAMPPPLNEGQVEYIDGTNASIDQMARDLTIFLQWTAEPEMEQRKAIGIKTIIYLIIFTTLFYVAKKRIWSKIK